MAGTKKGSFPECDFCTGICDDEKIQLVYEDPEFTKTFVNNMLESKLNEIVKDAYFMAEAISGSTNPLEIADFAYCIYVNLSQLVEMEPEKRLEIAVSFKQEFDKMVENIQMERQVAKKAEPEPEPEPVPVPVPKSARASAKGGKIVLKPVAVPAAKGVLAPSKAAAAPAVTKESKEFLKQLDADIAEIEEMSDQVGRIIADTGETLPPREVKPVQAPVISHAQLEPVLFQKPPKTSARAASVPAPAPSPLKAAGPRAREPGSKENPIKLTPELLEGNVVNVQDISKIEKGIKIKRVSIQKFTPQALSASGATIDVTKLGKGAPPVGAPGKRGKNVSDELFQAFNEVKAKGKDRDKALPKTFTPEILDTEEDRSPDTEKAGATGLAFEDEDTRQIGKKGSAGGKGKQKAAPFADEKAPAGGDHDISFAAPFTLDEPRPSKGGKADDADRVKVCHECNAINPIKNKFCNKCGFEF
jgi:hypothetical protein